MLEILLQVIGVSRCNACIKQALALHRFVNYFKVHESIDQK